MNTKKKPYKFNNLQLAWIKALKSGKYNQTTGTLSRYSPKKKKLYHCCLGVACRVCGDTPTTRIKQGDNVIISFDGCIQYVPVSVEKKLKLRSLTGSLKSCVVDEKTGKAAYSLISLNDDLKWSFKKIAEYIENNPENVFKP